MRRLARRGTPRPLAASGRVVPGNLLALSNAHPPEDDNDAAHGGLRLAAPRRRTDGNPPDPDAARRAGRRAGRALDRVDPNVVAGRVLGGVLFSRGAHFRRFPRPGDPSNRLGGLWKSLSPARPAP